MIRIFLLTILLVFQANSIYSQGSITNNNNKVIPFFSYDFDRLEVNFNDFSNNIDSINLANLNKLDNNFSMAIGLTKKKYYARINIGSIGNTEKYLDSINVKYRNYQFGLELGYFLLDYKGYIIKPCFSMNYICYRLVNFPSDKIISYNEYYAFNSVDLRINQFIGILKVRLELNPNDDITIGGYCGYAFKMNNKAFVHTNRNTIRNSHKVELNSITYGISTTLYIK
jgi:hypothetical protein